jgi:hypothetical protein
MILVSDTIDSKKKSMVSLPKINHSLLTLSLTLIPSHMLCRCRNLQQRILVKSEMLHFLNFTNSSEQNGAVVQQFRIFSNTDYRLTTGALTSCCAAAAASASCNSTG